MVTCLAQVSWLQVDIQSGGGLQTTDGFQAADGGRVQGGVVQAAGRVNNGWVQPAGVVQGGGV